MLGFAQGTGGFRVIEDRRELISEIGQLAYERLAPGKKLYNTIGVFVARKGTDGRTEFV